MTLLSNPILHHVKSKFSFSYGESPSCNKVLKSDSTRSLAMVENKYQTEGSRKSETPGLDIFIGVAGLFRELFEESRLMWRQCSFCCTRASGCLPLGTKCVWCVCAPAYVCVFQKGCTEPQPGAIPDYPSLSFNTPVCVCVCVCVCACVCVTHANTRPRTHTCSTSCGTQHQWVQTEA